MPITIKILLMTRMLVSSILLLLLVLICSALIFPGLFTLDNNFPSPFIFNAFLFSFFVVSITSYGFSNTGLINSSSINLTGHLNFTILFVSIYSNISTFICSSISASFHSSASGSLSLNTSALLHPWPFSSGLFPLFFCFSPFFSSLFL